MGDDDDSFWYICPWLKLKLKLPAGGERGTCVVEVVGSVQHSTERSKQSELCFRQSDATTPNQVPSLLGAGVK